MRITPTPIELLGLMVILLKDALVECIDADPNALLINWVLQQLEREQQLIDEIMESNEDPTEAVAQVQETMNVDRLKPTDEQSFPVHNLIGWNPIWHRFPKDLPELAKRYMDEGPIQAKWAEIGRHTLSLEKYNDTAKKNRRVRVNGVEWLALEQALFQAFGHNYMDVFGQFAHHVTFGFEADLAESSKKLDDIMTLGHALDGINVVTALHIINKVAKHTHLGEGRGAVTYTHIERAMAREIDRWSFDFIVRGHFKAAAARYHDTVTEPGKLELCAMDVKKILIRSLANWFTPEEINISAVQDVGDTLSVQGQDIGTVVEVWVDPKTGFMSTSRGKGELKRLVRIDHTFTLPCNRMGNERGIVFAGEYYNLPHEAPEGDRIEKTIVQTRWTVKETNRVGKAKLFFSRMFMTVVWWWMMRKHAEPAARKRAEMHRQKDVENKVLELQLAEAKQRAEAAEAREAEALAEAKAAAEREAKARAQAVAKMAGAQAVATLKVLGTQLPNQEMAKMMVRGELSSIENKAVVLQTDIKGFRALTQTWSAQKIGRKIGGSIDAMAEYAKRELGAWFWKSNGDSILLVFSVEWPGGKKNQHFQTAAEAALAAVKAAQAIHVSAKYFGYVKRVGIAFGPVNWFNLGSQDLTELFEGIDLNKIEHPKEREIMTRMAQIAAECLEDDSQRTKVVEASSDILALTARRETASLPGCTAIGQDVLDLAMQAPGAEEVLEGYEYIGRVYLAKKSETLEGVWMRYDAYMWESVPATDPAVTPDRYSSEHVVSIIRDTDPGGPDFQVADIRESTMGGSTRAPASGALLEDIAEERDHAVGDN